MPIFEIIDSPSFDPRDSLSVAKAMMRMAEQLEKHLVANKKLVAALRADIGTLEAEIVKLKKASVSAT